MIKNFRKICLISVITASSIVTNQAHADNSDFLLQTIANGINQLVQDAKGKWQAQLKLLYEKTPNVEQTAVINTNNVASNQQISAAYHSLDPQDLLATNIQHSLLPSSNNFSAFASLPGSDLASAKPLTSPFNNGKDLKLNPNNALFNFNTLFSPDAYQTLETNNDVINQQQLAQNYIGFLFQGSALPNDVLLDLTKLTPEQFNKLAQRKYFADYVLSTRAYVAAQSMALSNLYEIYNKRVLIPGLGQKAGLKQTDASVKQVENYLASRRVADTNWYQAMEKAAPATIMREILYTLAEIRYELYQSRQDSERLLATVSALELQTQTQGQMQFKITRQNAITAAGRFNIQLSGPGS